MGAAASFFCSERWHCARDPRGQSERKGHSAIVRGLPTPAPALIQSLIQSLGKHEGAMAEAVAPQSARGLGRI